MQILWGLGRGYVRDILAQFPDPKPKYNTVSTITRILEAKGFVGHKAHGKSYEYYPLVSKDGYAGAYLRRILQGYFDGSFANLVHFFSRHENLDVKEIEQVIEMLKGGGGEGK